MVCLFFSWFNRTSTRNFLVVLELVQCVWYVVVFWVEGGYKSCLGGKTLVGCVIFAGDFFGEVVVGRDGSVSFYSCIICDLQMYVGSIVSNIIVCHSEHVEHLKHPG